MSPLLPSARQNNWRRGEKTTSLATLVAVGDRPRPGVCYLQPPHPHHVSERWVACTSSDLNMRNSTRTWSEWKSISQRTTYPRSKRYLFLNTKCNWEDYIRDVTQPLGTRQSYVHITGGHRNKATRPFRPQALNYRRTLQVS